MKVIDLIDRKIEERSAELIDLIQHALREQESLLNEFRAAYRSFLVFRNALVVFSSTITLYKIWVFSETSLDLFRRLVSPKKLKEKLLCPFTYHRYM